MYQYILCLSKLPQAWADILLPRSGVLQQGLQYSKVTTGRVCAFRKVGEGGIKAVMRRGMKLKEPSLCSHVYSTFFHLTHTHTHTPAPPPSLHTCMKKLSHLSSSSLSPDICMCEQTFAHIHLNAYIDAHTHKRTFAFTCTWSPVAIDLNPYL